MDLISDDHGNYIGEATSVTQTKGLGGKQSRWIHAELDDGGSIDGRVISRTPTKHGGHHYVITRDDSS